MRLNQRDYDRARRLAIKHHVAYKRTAGFMPPARRPQVHYGAGADYLARAKYIDKTRSSRQARRRRYLQEFAVGPCLVTLAVATWLFGPIVLQLLVILTGLAIGVLIALRIDRRRKDRAETLRIDAEKSRATLVDGAAGWATWAEENDLPVSAEVWRAIAADTTTD